MGEEWNQTRGDPGQTWYYLRLLLTQTSHGPRLELPCKNFTSIFSIIVISLGNYQCIWWCMQWSLHARVNSAVMYQSVSYQPFGWSHLLISWGEICCISYYIIYGGLSWFIMEMVYPVSYLHSHLLDLSELLGSGWEYITEFHIPPCEFFPDLLLFLSIIFTTFLSLEMT